MTVSLETQQRIAELRQKARDGTLTLEETKEAVTWLRGERMAMPASPSKMKKPEVNADDLLKDLGI